MTKLSKKTHGYIELIKILSELNHVANFMSLKYVMFIFKLLWQSE